MDRRTVLKTLATLSVSLLLPRNAEAEEDSSLGAGTETSSPSGVLLDISPEEMGEQLVKNLKEYRRKLVEANPDGVWDEGEWELQEKVARRLPFALKDEQEAVGYFTSLTFAPKRPRLAAAWTPDLLKKVHFGVMTAPVGTVIHPNTGRLEVIAPLTRRVRVSCNLEACNDLRAYHGLDPIEELTSCLASETALEIGMECRHDCEAQGAPPAIYAISLPPFLSPTFLHPKGDFTFDRRYRMRYAKRI